MFKKIIHSLIERRHPWRTMKFSELAEIYTSMSLRSFGVGIIGIFVPVYLFKNGVDLHSIFYFYAAFFVTRIPLSYIDAYVIGRIGPKHSIALSTLIFVVFLAFLLSFNTVEWPLFILAMVYSISNGLFYLAYHTDFSKVKDSNHGGKELGWLYIFERGGGALGPIFGGLVASFVAPEITIVVAIAILLGSLVPLFMTNEPVKVHQKIIYEGFRRSIHLHDAISLSAFNIENAASYILWPLLVSVSIFTDDTYAKLGGVIGFATVLSLFSAHMFGKFIDDKSGLSLLRYGVIINAITHLIRPFVTTTGGVLAITVSNEPVTLSYRMPLIKGYYDVADSEEPYRIVYLSWTERMVCYAKCFFFVGLYVLSFWVDPLALLKWNFVLVAMFSLGILYQRFPALKKA
jgi:hypothetical protein